MKNLNYREILINSTISVIADEGLDKTTTKTIVNGTGVNEAYIYRFFDGKEDLLSKTFAFLDEELVRNIMDRIDAIDMKELNYEMRCRLIFDSLWRFLLGNKDKCLAYVRYYYSPYYQKYSAKEHQERYKPLVSKIGKVIKAEANTWMLLKHVLNVLLDFAVRVYEGEVSDSEDTTTHVFLLVYNSLKPYFKERELNV